MKELFKIEEKEAILLWTMVSDMQIFSRSFSAFLIINIRISLIVILCADGLGYHDDGEEHMGVTVDAFDGKFRPNDLLFSRQKSPGGLECSMNRMQLSSLTICCVCKL